MLDKAEDDLKKLRARFRKPILDAIRHLEYTADIESKNCHPLSRDYAPYWELRIGPHRAYYKYDEELVLVDSVRYKGRKTTDEVFKKP
jgi:mRNA-degrading endonuclease RelE of RelBE toxin-antitoxin system